VPDVTIAMCEPSPTAPSSSRGSRSRPEPSRTPRATTPNLRYGGVLGLLEAGAILGYSSRRAASRIGDAVYSEPHRGCSDRCSRPVTSRTLDLRAGLSGPRARGARTTGEYTSPFARLARPPNVGRQARAPILPDARAEAPGSSASRIPQRSRSRRSMSGNAATTGSLERVQDAKKARRVWGLLREGTSAARTSSRVPRGIIRAKQRTSQITERNGKRVELPGSTLFRRMWSSEPLCLSRGTG
jgi:hypothetical protein